MKVRIGIIVNYKTTAADQVRMSEHRSVCNVQAELPAVIVKVWSEDAMMVNLKVLLDGQGDHWMTSAVRGEAEGNWDFYPSERKEFTNAMEQLLKKLGEQKSELQELYTSIQEALEESKSVLAQIQLQAAAFQPVFLSETESMGAGDQPEAHNGSNSQAERPLPPINKGITL